MDDADHPTAAHFHPGGAVNIKGSTSVEPSMGASQGEIGEEGPLAPVVRRYTFAEIKARAERALADAGVIGIYPVPVEDIALSEGYIVQIFDLSENDEIAAAINHETSSIYVNERDVGESSALA